MSGIYRVQDADGRGPWRPGFSTTWMDGGGRSGPPAIWQELGVDDFHALVTFGHRKGYNLGCAMRGLAGIRLWFSKTEILRLRDFGFDIHDASAMTILHETPNQMLVAARHALRKLPKAPIWDSLIASYETHLH